MKTILHLIPFLLCGATDIAQANIADVHRWKTSNGASVIFYQAGEVPMLDIEMAFAAGSAYDGPDFGLSELTSSLLNQGSSELSATSLAEKLADTGTQFTAQASKDMIVIGLKTLSRPKNLDTSIELLNQIISHPAFPDDAFRREKSQQLMGIKQSQESPDTVATEEFFKTLYGLHPYGHPVQGTKETVEAIKRVQVLQFYKQYFTAKNAVLVMVGAINEATAHQLADKLTKDLPSGAAADPIPKAKELPEGKMIQISFPSTQTVIRLGQIGISHHDPDYFALQVGNYILGGGALVSRLANEVREKRGLTYGVYSQFLPMPGDGPFLISLSTKNSQAQEALNVTMDTVKGFLNNGPSAQELAAAKQYLTGSFPLSLASNNSIANMLLRISFFHLPDDYLQNYIKRIEKVSLDEIKKAYSKHLQPNKFLLITVGKK